MRALLLSVLLAATLFVAIITAPSSVHALSKAPSFVLDLDKPPQKRWEGAVELIIAKHGWKSSFGAIFDKYEKKFAQLPATLLSILNNAIKSKYAEQYEELTFLAGRLSKAGESGLNVSTFIPFVFFYELGDLNDGPTTFPPMPPSEYGGHYEESGAKKYPPIVRRAAAELREYMRLNPHADFFGNPLKQHSRQQQHRACTGILSLPANKSKDIIHGRNMDESPHQGRNCTLNITVVKGGKVLYHIFDWTWVTTGLATGSSIGGVTLEQNWREHGYLKIEDILSHIMQPQNVPTIFMFREILQKGFDFDATIKYLNTTLFAAPIYAVVSGTQRRGAVVTAAFNATDNVIDFINDSYKRYYMVQTNYDRWMPDPPRDDRRTVAERHLEMLGREVGGTTLGVWMVASVYPVHNPGTMYTALMGVDHPPIAYIRTIMVPFPR